MNLQETDATRVDSIDNRDRVRYAIMTVVIALPLLWSFATVTNVYPFTSWTVMVGGGSLQRPWTYFVVRGETVSGQVIDLRPSELTDGLYGRTWSMVGGVVNNGSFKITSPHPQNLTLINSGAVIPRGVRVSELLGVWGRLYNSTIPGESPARLKRVRLDVYRWESGQFQDYEKFVETWHSDL